ncbi:hypothetical protein HYH03_013352 [Edaphochlamys debaryana]|uniref:Sulfatase N-terminal domain-containing protein n=1 Tax=Edaphochlamys debaryana TaxID=47281 RepID=A0A835XR45_9CHLO|nr:hypothetical protein HYH03_013352 [Edaphochlamys debaryana]|eukprot:KAG2488047.1 hypothetical protein HYH03_013352 [Edaphochlamys debaryana]
MTDDQDEVLRSAEPEYMPAVNSLIGGKGMRFSNMVVPTSVCCPARVSALTGRLAHCTNVTGNWVPSGAFAKFASQQLDSAWLPLWLQQGGYRTHMVGKFLNGFGPPLGKKQRCPLGWDVLDALTRGTYQFFGSTFSYNCQESSPPNPQYQTDLIRDKVLGYLDDTLTKAPASPFFMMVTPVAPHIAQTSKPSVLGTYWQPPPPAPRHANLYPNVQLPANPTFLTPNPLISTNLWLNMTSPVNVNAMTVLYRDRLRSLKAVDEMVEAIVKKLEERGVLDNTYIIYTSDNGLHMGQHGLKDGKATNLEEETRVPFFIRGPRIPSGLVSPYQGQLVDLVPTLLALADLPIPDDLDGLPLPLEPVTMAAYDAAMRGAVEDGANRQKPPPPLVLSPPAVWRREGVLLEAWDSDAKAGYFPGVTFKSLRLCSTYRPDFTAAQRSAPASRPPAIMIPQMPEAGSPVFGPRVYCLKYSVWCKDNARELYDMSIDPYETNNLAAAAPAALINRLDAVMAALVHCKGSICANPYGVLHPAGDVVTFEQAMSPRYDALYAAIPPFHFETCYPLYVPANERAFTLGLPGFPPLDAWASTGIVWPLPNDQRGLGQGTNFDKDELGDRR